MSDPGRPDLDLSSWLAAIVASAEDAILSATVAGVIVTWNEAAERLYGFRADEVIGHHLSIVLPPDRAIEGDELLSGLPTGERIDQLESRHLRKDGIVIDVSLSRSPIRDRTGEIVGSAMIARDIGSRKRREEAVRRAQKMAAVERLASNVAHDFNNLLTAILGHGSLALERGWPARVERRSTRSCGQPTGRLT